LGRDWLATARTIRRLEHGEREQLAHSYRLELWMVCPEELVVPYPGNTTGRKGSRRQLPTMVAVPPSLLPTNWSTSSIGFATANELLPA